MQYSDAALEALTEDSEGLALRAYPDPGTGGAPWTNGWGHTGPDVYPGQVISRNQAVAWILHDTGWAVTAVNDLVKVRLTQHQFDALVDFTFNEGAHNFAMSTLLRLVNAQDFAGADLEFGKWIRGAGKILPGLQRRRAAEASWFMRADA